MASLFNCLLDQPLKSLLAHQGFSLLPHEYSGVLKCFPLLFNFISAQFTSFICLLDQLLYNFIPHQVNELQQFFCVPQKDQTLLLEWNF